MPRPYFKKVLKYWTGTQSDSRRPLSKLQMDVTKLRCEEDDRSIQLLDEAGRIIAEFGPGQQYDQWMLTVEYSSPR